MTTQYPAASWLDPRVEVRPSPIEGLGLFAKALIREGETVAVMGGKLLTDAELAVVAADTLARGATYSAAAIGEGIHLLQAPDDPLRYGNHACDSNLWMADEVTFCARRDIGPGEELTVDYALFTVDPDARMECRCGSPLCRGMLTGDDWRLAEVQQRYAGHFAPFVDARIASAKSPRT